MIPEPKITKTLSMDRSVALAIEEIARRERRSFTRQVELILENALSRESHDAVVIEEAQS